MTLRATEKELALHTGLCMSRTGCLRRRSRSDRDSSLSQREVLADNGADVTTEYGTEPVAIESAPDCLILDLPKAARHEDSDVDFVHQEQFGHKPPFRKARWE